MLISTRAQFECHTYLKLVWEFCEGPLNDVTECSARAALPDWIS